MSLDLPRLAILGAGSMGGAILAGVMQSDRARDGVVVTNRSAGKADGIRFDGVESLALERDAAANRTAVRGARIVLVGVKPAMVRDLLVEVADALEPGAIVVSLAAGVTIATMEAAAPGHPVIRSMPNTPSLVRRGVTGLAAGGSVTPGELALVRALFETVGEVVEVQESQIDALGTISGSGPAYVFFLIERLTETARRLGFSDADARMLVESTFRGSAELLAASDVDPAELRRRVTSPNGTTERAIAVLDAADLDAVFDRATAAALARAAELAKGG